MEFSQATELSLLPRRREERVAQTDKSIPWLSSISHLPPQQGNSYQHLYLSEDLISSVLPQRPYSSLSACGLGTPSVQDKHG